MDGELSRDGLGGDLFVARTSGWMGITSLLLGDLAAMIIGPKGYGGISPPRFPPENEDITNCRRRPMSICSDRMTHRRVWSAIRTLPFLLVLVASVAVTDLRAQRPESTTLPPPAGLTGAVEDSLWQVWEHDQPFLERMWGFPERPRQSE